MRSSSSSIVVVRDGEYFASDDVDDIAIPPRGKAAGGRRRGVGGGITAMEDSIARFALLEAMSTLHRRTTVDEIGVVADDASARSDDEDRNGAAFVVRDGDGGGEADGRISRRKGDDDDSVVPADVASHPPSGDADACDDIDATRRRTREGLDDDLRGGRHHDAEGRYERIVRAFEVERSGHHGLLTDRHLVDMFHFLVNRDVILSYEVLRLYAIRCERDGKLVGLDMYQRIINRIRSHHRPRHRRPHSESTEHDASNSEYDPTPRKMRSGELNRLIRDMTRHIQETYSNGTKRIYRHMLLPELAVAVMESNVDVVKCHAASIMNYVLERDDDFPVLDPELYEMLLSKGRRGGVVVGETDGRDGHFPYRKLLSRLVSSGESLPER